MAAWKGSREATGAGVLFALTAMSAAPLACEAQSRGAPSGYAHWTNASSGSVMREVRTAVCEQITVVQRLAAIQGDMDTANAAAALRARSCLRARELMPGARWPNGNVALHPSGQWNYPNGNVAMYPSGQWLYPNANVARNPSGQWLYPNTNVLYQPSGEWLFIDGTRSSEAALLARACSLVDQAECARARREVAQAGGFWRGLAVLELVWRTSGQPSGGPSAAPPAATASAPLPEPSPNVRTVQR